MSVLERTSVALNGMPEWKPYVYRGTGEDTLTADVVFPDEPGTKSWLKPCGTDAAYRRHLRRGDPPCAECREANALRQADRYRKDPHWTSVHASHGGKPRCGAVNAHAIAEPGQEVTCKRCHVYAEEAEVKR